MQKGKYDLFVIGAGPAGYAAAILAAKNGMNVAISESGNTGGTCTNRGCIPTKSYIESIKLYKKIGNASKYGIEADARPANLASICKRKDRIVTRLSKGIEYLLKINNIELHSGRACLAGGHSVKIGDETFESNSMIIATGSMPDTCPFDIKGIWSSDDALSAQDIPKSLLVVGGGAIGMEMAYFYASLGTDVTVVEAMERILPGEDDDVSGMLVKTLRNVRFFTSAKISDIEYRDNFIATVVSSGKEDLVKTEKILWCTGRRPVVPQGIEVSGVSLNQKGGILVDRKMRTTVPDVYAVGDVTGEWMLAYVAIREAEVAVENILGKSVDMDYSAIPSIIFTSPEIASVGIKPQDTNGLRKGSFPVAALGRARTSDDQEGFANVYMDEGKRIKRVTIASPHATDMISWACLAVKKGMTINEFLEPVYTHPTFSELLKEAAEDCLGMSIHKG